KCCCLNFTGQYGGVSWLPIPGFSSVLQVDVCAPGRSVPPCTIIYVSASIRASGNVDQAGAASTPPRRPGASRSGVAESDLDLTLPWNRVRFARHIRSGRSQHQVPRPDQPETEREGT